MTAEELCQNLRALSPGYYKMDGDYVDIGREAANEIEWLINFVKSLESAADQNLKEAERLASKNDWLRTALRAAQTTPDAQREIYDKVKGHAVTDAELGEGDFARYADEYNRERSEDKPLGFRTNDVPDPYAEGPQSDEEPCEHDTRSLSWQLRTRFVEWAVTRGDRNFTRLGGGYLLPEIQKAWLAFRAGANAIEQFNAEPAAVHAITRALRHFEKIICDAGRWSGICQEELKAALRQIDALAQSNAEPTQDVRKELEKAVSRLVCKGACLPEVNFGLDCAMCRTKIRQGIELLLPLTALPHPDASAGLIEAAEIVKDWSRACSNDSEANLLDNLEKQLRARAAERSGE